MKKLQQFLMGLIIFNLFIASISSLITYILRDSVIAYVLCLMGMIITVFVLFIMHETHKNITIEELENE